MDSEPLSWFQMLQRTGMLLEEQCQNRYTEHPSPTHDSFPFWKRRAESIKECFHILSCVSLNLLPDSHCFYILIFFFLPLGRRANRNVYEIMSIRPSPPGLLSLFCSASLPLPALQGHSMTQWESGQSLQPRGRCYLITSWPFILPLLLLLLGGTTAVQTAT